VPIGILSVTREGQVRTANFAAARVLDVPLKDLTDASLLELAQGDDRIAVAALLREERFSERELPLRTAGGERRHLVASGRPLPDGALAVIVHDATAEMKRRRTRATEEKMASLGRLAAGVAHEFGNVMATLYGYAQLASRELSQGAPGTTVQELVAAVASASERSQLVTDALHAFEHMPSGELEPVELADVAQKVLNALHGEIERAQVRVERRIEGRGPVLGQRAPIEESVLALVRNAVEACRGPAGVVTVSLEDTPEKTVLAVTDNGPGIPEELRDRIFDPFFTTKGSLGVGPSMSGGTGLGLGLAVAWNRVREHEGEIDFETRQGATTFRIVLPRRRENPPRPDTGAHAIPRPTRRRPRRSILVMDPDESMRSLVEAQLKADHWVRAVASGADALAAYDAPRAFDFVVLDVAAAGTPSGVEVFSEIKRRDPRAKIVLLTERPPDDDAVKACAPGAYAVLRKPGQAKDVRELLA
jgi:signal transduction histidine kinase